MRPSEGHICHLVTSSPVIHDPNLIIRTYSQTQTERQSTEVARLLLKHRDQEVQGPVTGCRRKGRQDS